VRNLAAVLLIVWAGACGARASGPPAILLDRSACARCGMLISERAYAAAITFPDGRTQLFDDVGCLVAAARQQTGPDVRYWFHDDADGTWIEGTNPVFVVSPALNTPMGGGIVAFRDRAAAERVAQLKAGRVVSSVTELLQEDGSKR
jgi:copper chaperone NosL